MPSFRNNITLLCLLLSLFFLCSSCDSGGSSSSSGAAGWNLSPASPTNVVPQSGQYSFSQQGSFSVLDGGGAIRFSRDNYRFDTITVQSGAFYHAHGEINGTDCPTDSYAISGSFTDSTHASGVISYATDCSITHASLPFTAVRR